MRKCLYATKHECSQIIAIYCTVIRNNYILQDTASLMHTNRLIIEEHCSSTAAIATWTVGINIRSNNVEEKQETTVNQRRPRVVRNRRGYQECRFANVKGSIEASKHSSPSTDRRNNVKTRPRHFNCNLLVEESLLLWSLAPSVHYWPSFSTWAEKWLTFRARIWKNETKLGENKLTRSAVYGHLLSIAP